MANTTLGYPYAVGTDQPAGHTQGQALAEAVDASPGVTPMTDATISGLSAGLKRAGRVIWRSTVGRLAVFDGSSALDLAFLSDVTTHAGLTAAHGATGAVVGETNTQTLSNKTIASPALTGTPTAPTAAAGTNTTQVATTEFVQQELGGAGFHPFLLLGA